MLKSYIIGMFNVPQGAYSSKEPWLAGELPASEMFCWTFDGIA
jgi:hypothetical protein